jgi:hypothetical protein
MIGQLVAEQLPFIGSRGFLCLPSRILVFAEAEDEMPG